MIWENENVKVLLKAIYNAYGSYILIAGFYLVMIPTFVIVLWETFTGQSIIDKIWDIARGKSEESDNDRTGQDSEALRTCEQTRGKTCSPRGKTEKGAERETDL